MSKLFAGGAVLLLLLAVCGSDDGSGQWSEHRLWNGGSRPVPSPDGGAVLLLQETEPAGLYLLRGGQGIAVSTGGEPVRADYSWSRQGDRFAFSRPGDPGAADAGIFAATLSEPATVARIWDRGSHPRFLPEMDALICAGPEDGSGWEGIWQINLFEQNMIRLALNGRDPDVSPDGRRISYRIGGGTNGRTLVVLNRETGDVDTLAANVLAAEWLGDSQTIAYEIVNGGVQEIRTIRAEAGQSPAFMAIGTAAAAFPDSRDFVFTSIAGDRSDGLWIAAPGRSPERLWPSGTLARPVSSRQVIAQDGAGVFELRR